MRSNIAAWEGFATAAPGARARRDGGAIGIVSGVALSGFNGVWGEAVDVDPAAVARLLDEVREAGVPHCLELREGWPDEVGEVARERGLVRVEGEPVMLLEDGGALDGALAPAGLSLRQLAPDEGGLHARVAVAGGVVGREGPYRELMTPEVLRTPGLRCYLGEVDGEAVTTALAFATDDCVGIFSVATLPAYRRRGYGGAVTARAARDGLDTGARWAWLSASAAGLPVYRALGFLPIYRLDMWEQART